MESNRFKAGEPLLAQLTASRLNSLIENGVQSVGGALQMVRGPNGTSLFVSPFSGTENLGLTAEQGAAFDYVDTPVLVPVTLASSACILPVSQVPGDPTNGFAEFDSGDYATIKKPGRYLLIYQATCEYSEGATQAKNVSDTVTRLRLEIGGTMIAGSAAYGAHHCKLNVAGLVRGVNIVGSTISGFTDMNPVSGDYGKVTGTIDGLTVQTVDAYDTYAYGSTTITGVFQILVADYGDGLKIVSSAVPTPPTLPTTQLDPVVKLYVDRFDIEPPVTAEPFASNWLAAGDTVMTCRGAKLHIIKLL